MQPIYEFNTPDVDKPVLHLAVANGFPPQTYERMLRPFMSDYRVICLPPRPLWPGEPVPERLIAWNNATAVDLLNGLRDHNLRDVVAVGHSFGGVATLLAAIREPSRFKAVILLDPTILPQKTLWVIRLARGLGLRRANALAERAQKRRETFADAEEAFAYFREKRLFAGWPDETVRDYVASFTRTGDDLTLGWPREWEAYIFRTIYAGIWGDIPRFKATNLPLLLVRAEHSNALSAASAARIRQMLPEIDYVELADQYHLFPQAAPQATAQIMSEWLAQKQLAY